MNNSNTSVRTETLDSARISPKAKEIYHAVRSSRIVKAVGYMVVAVAGLFALGGLFRVLAWTATGYNQLAGSLAGKKG